MGYASAATPAGKKVALVMGNSAYKHAVELPNPKNDAKLMAETFRAAGFTVIEGEDLDKVAMTALVDQFTEIAYDAEIAVVYYAGHGLQVDGRNYLVPIDAQLEKAAQLQTRTVPAEKFLAALPPDPAVSIIILDACRDNPLARSLAKVLPASRSASMGVGLAPVQANGQSSGAGGLLIAYATDPGAVAYDGKGINSPYTAALARHLTTPGLEIQSALTRVRADVSEATGGAQHPWHNASLSREVFIGGDAAAQAAAVVPNAVKPSGEATSAAGANDVNWTVEQKLWEEASKRNTVAHYELYLQQYPAGNFATLAKLNLDQLKATATTQVAAVAPAGEATASASQVRTAVSVPDDVKLTVGTPETEALLNLDRNDRIDLQLRLGALGHVTGGADGTLGAKSRTAIGAWQRQNGMVETTYLTEQQHMFLTVQTDPMMPQIRAQFEAQKKAAIAVRKAQAPVRQKVAGQQRVRRQHHQEDTLEGPVERRGNSGGADPAGAAFAGGLIGGALGGILSNR
ncbi:hypothetical protein ADU59_12830 [Pararhizobium polonicum]|uniref:Caspase family p20 domain-containing protein n=2 Tax=Pararhizobium polonicum TaxID=1612624 RepID=A0A1C7P2D5_9HYPH|nr:hypothetical protein ADU59_12830 [Pararhizobium polonicum]